MIHGLRVASMQYFIRPVRAFSDFADQVEGLVGTAADYKCKLVVFPEYFTVQLLTLGDVHRPIREQIRHLSKQLPQYLELFERVAKKYKLYIVAGSIPVADSNNDDLIYNNSHIFGPSGTHDVQSKLHMTRFEAEDWKVSPGNSLKIFETDFGKLAITICYDVEFPELARAAARKGALILVAPSCTDDRQGYLRVRYCAHARAIENQMYVMHACTVGSLPNVPAVSLNYGQASILTPSDFRFSRDGILAEGAVNQETMVIGELDLKAIEESRISGTVLPLRDSQTTASVMASIEEVALS